MTKTATRVSLLSLYGVFLRLGLYSFGGGISSWVHREIVILRQWVTEEEFMAGYALGQILPPISPSLWASICAAPSGRRWRSPGS
jgi:chromate transporter